MSSLPRDFDSEELHPIDIAESLAAERSWDFDRLADDQIAMMIEGTWRCYSLTLVWSPSDMTLRLVCAYEFLVAKKRINALNAAMCLANDRCWSGAFVLWREQKLLGYRYALNLAGDAQASSAQINDMVQKAVLACERFYPAFQLVASGNTAEVAIGFAMDEAYGRA